MPPQPDSATPEVLNATRRTSPGGVLSQGPRAVTYSGEDVEPIGLSLSVGERPAQIPLDDLQTGPRNSGSHRGWVVQDEIQLDALPEETLHVMHCLPNVRRQRQPTTRPQHARQSGHRRRQLRLGEVSHGIPADDGSRREPTVDA